MVKTNLMLMFFNKKFNNCKTKNIDANSKKIFFLYFFMSHGIVLRFNNIDFFMNLSFQTEKFPIPIEKQ